MKNNIAFIGSVGVPNNYGGFEMFLETCCPELLHTFDKVYVTCDKSRYQDRARDWQGVTRVFIPVRANGALSVFHDFLAFFSVLLQVRAIVVLGVSGGVFFPLLRLLCEIFGKKLIVNVDGVEWRRGKFSNLKRAFLFASDRLAQIFAHRVVVDNEALRGFLAKSVQADAVLIAYPGDHVLRIPKTKSQARSDDSFLTICRIEPENNCHLLIKAFAKAGRGRYVFVGNWGASEYGRKLRAKYARVEGLEMRDPVYDKNVLASLREECDVYLHGHSVGGTNPSLVEMLFYDCRVVAFDCAFNRCTAGEAIDYFASADHLARKIGDPGSIWTGTRTDVRDAYSRARICAAYTKVILALTGVPAKSDAPVPQQPAVDIASVPASEDVVEAT